MPWKYVWEASTFGGRSRSRVGILSKEWWATKVVRSGWFSLAHFSISRRTNLKIGLENGCVKGHRAHPESSKASSRLVSPIAQPTPNYFLATELNLKSIQNLTMPHPTIPVGQPINYRFESGSDRPSVQFFY